MRGAAELDSNYHFKYFQASSFVAVVMTGGGGGAGSCDTLASVATVSPLPSGGREVGARGPTPLAANCCTAANN